MILRRSGRKRNVTRFDWRSSPYAELLIVALAAVVRFWRLSYHSLWFDEAVSLQWATSNPVWTWQRTFSLAEDKHPPGYYLLLHYWIDLLDLVGLPRSDTALRAFGSILGVLTVVGLLLLVRRLSGRPTALLAGLLVALSPVLVWYSQEMRMFQPATTALVWAGLFLLWAWETPAPGWRWMGWLGFVVALALALYTYLFSAFLLPAVGLTLLLLFWTSHPPRLVGRLVEGILALAVATLLFLPLAYNAWAITGAEEMPGQAFAGLDDNLWRLLRIFTLWRVEWPPFVSTGALLILGGLLLAGITIPFQSEKNPHPSAESAKSAVYRDRVWLILWLGTPLLIGHLLLARSASVFAEDRYFLFLAPFALWAVARGAVGLGRRQRWAGTITGVVAVALLAGALPHLWTPAMLRENWRAAADYIVVYQQASPTLPGAVVAHVDYTRRPLERYLRRGLAPDQLPLFFPYGGALIPEQIENVIAPPLRGIVDQGFATLWLTQSHLEGVDDERLVERWLNEHFPLVTEQYPTGIKLSGYALQSRFDRLPELASGAHYLAVELAPGLQLAACEVMTKELAAQDEQMHPPSGWVHVRLWWRATATLDDDYIARVQMVGPEGVWGERLYRDNEALRRWPTGLWTPGEIVRDEVDVNLNPVTPAGEYPIVVGLLDGTGQPLAATAECGRVRVVGS
jgi:4-amino-4-deoxy-L-arabinose transferase-like glycosyltransferase